MTGCAIAKPDGDCYDTSDQMMCEVLLMSGFHAISVTPGSDGQLVYSFSMSEVRSTVESVLTNHADSMTFSLTDWWRAKITWQLNLRHLSKMRRDRER